MHSTIEEWMIEANRAVATLLWQRLPGSALLRHHAPPKPHKFAELLDCAKALGIRIDTSSNAALAQSLAAAGAALEQRRAGSARGEEAAAQDEWALRILKNLVGPPAGLFVGEL